MMRRLFYQFYHECCRGCCDWRRHRSSTEPRSIPFVSYLQVIATKFLLEVMGAAGAVWGSSEILFLRDTPTDNERMRFVAMFVGGIFFIRYWWHAKHWWQHERDYWPVKTHHRRTHMLSFFQIHASKFVLQVLGGAGAIWGCAEAMTLRNSNNTMEWRIAAMAVGCMFLIRWTFQILAYCLYLAALWSNPASVQMKILRWYEALVVMLILEVFGAVGAVWGFSEIVTLRNPDTNKIWRPISLAVGVIFIIRWIIHLFKFVKAEKESVHAKSQVQVDETRSHEVEDLEASDLQLKESVESEWNENASIQLHTSMEVNETLEVQSPPSPIPQSPTSPGPEKQSTPLKRHVRNQTMSYQMIQQKELLKRTQTS